MTWDQLTKKLNQWSFRLISFFFPPQPKAPPKNPQRILVFSPTGIGDNLMDSVAIKSLRKAFPKAEILVCAHRRRMAMALHNPYIDEVIPLSKSPLVQAKLLWRCWRNPVDMVVALQINEEVVPLGYLICRNRFFAIRERVEPMPFLVSHLVTTASIPGLIGKSLAVAQAAGGADVPPSMAYQVKKEEKEALWKKFPQLQKTPYIIIQPGGGKAIEWRNWPPQYYLEVIRWLHETYPQIQMILTGGGENQGAGKMLEQHHPYLINLITKTTLEETAALLSEAKMLLSSVTGIMHLGFAIDTPTVALVHYRVADLCSPLDTTAGHQVIELIPSPEDDPNNPTSEEMQRLPVKEVKAAIKRVLG